MHEYAFTLLIPILGGLFLGYWLQQNYGLSAVWSILFGILGMVAGFWMMYKRFGQNIKPVKFEKKQEPGGEHPDSFPWRDPGFFDEEPDDKEWDLRDADKD